MDNQSNLWNIISWLFGIGVFGVGLLNMFWGNDTWFGVFILLLSFVFFPPVTALFRRKTGLSIPGILKIVVGILIVWVTLGVGDFFDKLNLMIKDL